MKPTALSLGVALALGVASQSPAAPITFTQEGLGSGTLNNVPFPVSDFVITAVGDTDDRTSFGKEGFTIVHITASISIDGVGTVDFITATLTFVNNETSFAGFSKFPPLGDLFDVSDPIFASWDMLSSIGPVTDESGWLLQWGLSPVVVTTGGVLFFDTDLSVMATFTASTIAPGCPWDCGGDDDGDVGIVDFLELLAQWGTPGSCDFDGGGVGITDFLALLANWGPCP